MMRRARLVVVIDDHDLDGLRESRCGAPRHRDHALRKLERPRDVRAAYSAKVGLRCGPLRPLESAASRLLDAVLVQRAVAHTALQRLHKLLEVGWTEQDVAPGIERPRRD